MNAATAIRARLEAAGETSIWQAPDMSILAAGRSKPVPMPHDLFGDLWPLVADLADGAGAPVDYVGVGVLAVAASLIGASYRVKPFATSHWNEPCILWMAPVGDPSSNKSPAIDAATAPLRPMEADLADGHKAALQSFEARLERAKQERTQWQADVKTATKDGVATPPLPDVAVLPDEPVRRRLLVQDATPEAMGEILSGNTNGTLHLRDELAGWLMSFERYSPGGREFWLEAYGGRPHVIDRKSMKAALTIPFNGVTVLGGIQPEKLSDCLLNVADDGLVARFLWAWPDPIPYRRPRHVADVDKLERVYRRLASLARPEEDPVTLPLSAAAADIFEAWIGDNDGSIRDAASLYKGFCGKLKGAVLRLSLVAEMLAWSAGNSPTEPAEVSAASIVAALTFADDYAKPTALRVFGDAAKPPAERDAALLAKHILTTKAGRINGRDVRRESGIPSLKQAAAVDAALEVLLEADWLRAAPVRAGGSAGRASKDFLVNPAVHGGAHG